MSRRRPLTGQNHSQTLTDQATTSISQAESKLKQSLTVLWHEIPSWQQDNQYITSGYRPPTNSFRRSFHSLSYIHNETVNIWSHLLGALFSVTASLYFYNLLRPRYAEATKADVAMFSCYFVGAGLCLGMSATYHTISNHSQHVNRVGNQLDYVGIVCLIWGSFVPSIFYGFAEHVVYRWIYWGMVSLASVLFSPPLA